MLLLISCHLNILAQDKTVTGVVLDKTGETVIGASVLVKGTTNGTITDVDGNFTLKNVQEDAVLQVSFVGYKAQDVALKGCIGLAEQCRAVACDQPGQGGARLGASRYDRFVTLDARKFPAFADLLLVGGDVLVGDDLFAAPDCRFENGLELIHNFLFPDAVKNYCCFCASSWLRANA